MIFIFFNSFALPFLPPPALHTRPAPPLPPEGGASLPLPLPAPGVLRPKMAAGGAGAGRAAVRQEELRRLMREKQRQNADKKRIESPFARYPPPQSRGGVWWAGGWGWGVSQRPARFP